MTDYQVLQRRRNLVVGVFVLLAFLAFVWMLFQFRNLPLFATQFRSFMMYVYFPEAPGIHRDTPVNYRGYQIGRVRDIHPPLKTVDDDGHIDHRVRIDIWIENTFREQIPDTAVFTIIRRGLGSSFIEVGLDPDEPSDDFLRAGLESYRGQVATGTDFFPPGLQKKLDELVVSITALSQNTNAIVGDPDNRANIKQALENVAVATAQATETLKSLQGFANVGTERVDETAGKFNETLDSIQGLTEVGAEQIEAVALSLDGALKEFRLVLSNIHSGDGTAAKLLNDGRLYENLLDSSRELELALDQIKRWAAHAREEGIRIKW